MKTRAWHPVAQSVNWLTTGCVACVLPLALTNPSVAIQIQRIQAVNPFNGPVAIQQEDDKDSKPKKEVPTIDTNSVREKTPEIGKQFAQLHLQDGSIIGGDIKTESIDVSTAYGVLNVPISRVVKIYPGINSRPEFRDKIAQLVEELGGPNSTGRDAAQKELVNMGVVIRNVLNQLGNDGNAERKKRMAEIQASFEEEIETMEEEFLDVDRPVSFDDMVVTPDFSIVGEIQQKQFFVKSKFGDLKVNLGDIVLADRKIDRNRPAVRRSVSVPARAFFQTKPQSTGIRVNKGDKISIRASGVVQWTNFSSSSSPEGVTNRSQWNGINSGKLTARIGSDNRRCVQIGSSGEFVAKSSGVLYLGIAMRDSYATNSGYNWTGEYKAKVVVLPSDN